MIQKKAKILVQKIVIIFVLFIITNSFVGLSIFESKQIYLNPTNPIINNPITIFAYDEIEIYNSYGFVSQYYENFLIYDFSNSTDPQIVNSIQTFQTTHFQIADNYFYSLNESQNDTRIIIYEINSTLGFTKTDDYIVFNNTIGTWGEGFDSYEFYIFENILLIPKTDQSSFNTNNYEYEIDILNISLKNNIQKISSFNTSGHIIDLCFENNSLYLLHNTRQNKGDNKLEVFDLENLENITKTQTIALDSYPTSIEMFGNKLAIVYPNFGVEFYTYPQDSTLNRLYKISTATSANALLIEDDLAYILFEDRLVISNLTITNGYNILGQKIVKFQGEGSIEDLEKVGDIIYAVRQVTSYNAPLFIFDCSELSNPELIYPTSINEFQYNSWLLIMILGFGVSPLIILTIITLLVIKAIRNKRKEKQK